MATMKDLLSEGWFSKKKSPEEDRKQKFKMMYDHHSSEAVSAAEGASEHAALAKNLSLDKNSEGYKVHTRLHKALSETSAAHHDAALHYMKRGKI